MNESLVQWTLLNNLDFLSKSLDFKIAKKKGQEITTDFGRIDFIVEDFNNNQMIVELETMLNQKSKLEYCFNQMINYKNVSFTYNTEYCILYASETNRHSRLRIDRFGEDNDIIIRNTNLFSK